MDMHDGDLTSFKHQSDYITTNWQITIKLIQSLNVKYMWLGPLTNYLRQSRQLNCVVRFFESNLVTAYDNEVLLEMHNAYMIYIGHKFAYTSFVQTYLLYYEYNIYARIYW